jgi:hypothetical protein
VQGHLRNEYLTITIDTNCAYSGKPLQIEVDSRLKCHVLDEASRPMVFTPQVDWERFHEPNIIHAY